MSNGIVSTVDSLPPLGGAASGGTLFGTVQSGDIGRLLGQLDSAGAAQGNSAAPSAGEASPSVFQKLWRPLGEFRKNFDHAVNDISGIVARGNISMQDLIHIQFQMTQLSYMNDITAKTADKLSQGTQTLFRNSG
ncbi:MAG: hypothetical protein LBF24_00225 [Puniceicoccales bacterium]|jgi:hypothetical protein|nr:hypothetical protein [Puniceicoccales bacterium]